jgi:hypothetical protein
MATMVESFIMIILDPPCGNTTDSRQHTPTCWSSSEKLAGLPTFPTIVIDRKLLKEENQEDLSITWRHQQILPDKNGGGA